MGSPGELSCLTAGAPSDLRIDQAELNTSACSGCALILKAEAAGISTRVRDLLQPGVTGRVVGSFSRGCLLATDAGQMAAVVWGDACNGPLNVVLRQGPRTTLRAGGGFRVRGPRLCFSGGATGGSPCQVVDLAQAKRFDARLPWEQLAACRAQISRAAGALATLLAQSHAQPGMAPGQRRAVPSSAARAADAVLDAVLSFMAAVKSRETSAQVDSLSGLCGMGPGLTPAGDDWLAGWLLASHLAADPEASLAAGARITRAAAGATTGLSRSLLACAADGEADAHWHRLLAALARSEARSDNAGWGQTHAAPILAQGASSGAMMLGGFLMGIPHWLACQTGATAPAGLIDWLRWRIAGVIVG